MFAVRHLPYISKERTGTSDVIRSGTSNLTASVGLRPSIEIPIGSAGATICGVCMVGEYVPVFRPSRQRWCLGQVTRFHSHKPFRQFCLVFGTLGSDLEWLDIDPQPYVAYVKHHRGEVTDTVERTSSREFANHVDVKKFLAYDPRAFLSTSSNEFVRLSRSVKLPTNSDILVVSPEERHAVAAARLWSIDEDRLLTKAIARFREPFRWSIIAEDVRNRTGKQCRERYFNHLRASLNRSEWTPVDDAMLYYFYKRIGPKWTEIASLLQRRNNNNTKNRYHFIRRRLAKDVVNIQEEKSQHTLGFLQRVSERNSIKMRGSTNDVIHAMAHRMDKKKPRCSAVCDGSRLFALIDAVVVASCRRCGLLVPSEQTGHKHCSSTGWCESCVLTPPYVYDDLLRLVHAEWSHSEDTNGAIMNAIAG